MVRKGKLVGFKISIEAGELLKQLKDSPFWPAIKEYMASYVEFQKDRAFTLSERDEHFPLNHAYYSNRASALRDFEHYVEKGVHRASEEEDDV